MMCMYTYVHYTCVCTCVCDHIILYSLHEYMYTYYMIYNNHIIYMLASTNIHLPIVFTTLLYLRTPYTHTLTTSGHLNRYRSRYRIVRRRNRSGTGAEDALQRQPR